MRPGEGYVGLKQLLESNKIREYKDLSKKKHVEALKRDLEEEKYAVPKFHIIRIPGKKKGEKIVDLCKEVFFELPPTSFVSCDSSKGNSKVNEELEKDIQRHTFLFIKETLRCAITLTHKEKLGFLYDRVSNNAKDDVIAQGLAGRACGYNTNPSTIVYTKQSVFVRMSRPLREGSSRTLVMQQRKTPCSTQAVSRTRGLLWRKKIVVKRLILNYTGFMTTKR